MCSISWEKLRLFDPSIHPTFTQVGTFLLFILCHVTSLCFRHNYYGRVQVSPKNKRKYGL